MINRINEFENLPAFHSFLPLRFVAAALLPFYVSCYTALQFYRVRVKLLLLTLTTCTVYTLAVVLLFYILLLYVVAADLAGYPHEHPEDQVGGLRQARTIRSNGERH